MNRLPALFLSALFLAATVPAESATYSWVGGTLGAYTAAANWFPARTTPATDDRLIFQSGATIQCTSVPTQTIGQLMIGSTTSVTFTGASSTITLTLGGGAGVDLDIQAGSTVTLTGISNAVNVQLGTGSTGLVAGQFRTGPGNHKLQARDSNAITFLPGSSAVALQDFNTYMFGFGDANSAPNSVRFQSGSSYVHGDGNTPFGAAPLTAVVVFEAGSWYRVNTSHFILGDNRTFANIEFNGPGTSTIGGTSTCTLDSLIINAGLFRLNQNAETVLKGSLRLASGARLIVGPTTGTGSLRFGGVVEQEFEGSMEFPESAVNGFTFQPNVLVVIDNPAGVRFLGTPFPRIDLPGGVHLQQGVFHLDNFTALLTWLGPVTGGSATNWIDGRLQAQMLPSQPTRTFPIGTPTESTPITLALHGMTDTVTVHTVMQSPGHPLIAPLLDSTFIKSQIDLTKKVNLGYNMNIGVPGPWSSFDVTLGYQPANVDPGADPSMFVARVLSLGDAGDTWQNHANIVSGVNSMQLLGVTPDHTNDAYFGFVLGEPAVIGISVEDASVEEGGGALRTPSLHGSGGTIPFRVVLSGPALETITVDYATSGGSAAEGDDYAPQAGTVTFPPGVTEQFVEVPLVGEGDAEPHETFSLLLSNASGAILADAEGTGTIIDDDDTEPPVATVTWPNGGETIIENSTVELLWTATDNVMVDHVKLRISRNGGATWQVIAPNVPNTGSYTWTVPPGLTQQALFEVGAFDHRGHLDADASDALWSIWGVDDVSPVNPTAFALDLVSENPSRSGARLRLAMPREQAVHAAVFDVRGRRVETLVDRVLPTGVHDLAWSGKDAGAGLYFVEVNTEGYRGRARIIRLP